MVLGSENLEGEEEMKERARFMAVAYALAKAIHPRYDWPEAGIRSGAYTSRRTVGWGYASGRLIGTIMVHDHEIVLKEGSHGKSVEMTVAKR